MPTVPGEERASAISAGPTTCTLRTPAAMAAKASSSLGIMPPVTTPRGDGGAALGDGQRGQARGRIVGVAAHAAHRRSPPPALSASSGGGELAGGQVGVEVEHLAVLGQPEAGDHRHVAAAAQSASSSARSIPTTSPTSPKSIGSGPPPETTRGGRRRARSTPLPACSPTAPRPAPRRAAHSSTLSRPATTISSTSSVAASVIRRPPTSCVFTPSRPDSAVTCAPPPWTMSRRSAGRWPSAAGNRAAPPRRAARLLEHVAAQLDDRDRHGASRPPAGVFERERLGQAEHQVHVLDGLAGATLDQVVGGRLHRQRAASRRRARPARS